MGCTGSKASQEPVSKHDHAIESSQKDEAENSDDDVEESEGGDVLAAWPEEEGPVRMSVSCSKGRTFSDAPEHQLKMKDKTSAKRAQA